MPKAKKERRVPDHIAAAKKRGDSQYLREQPRKPARLKRDGPHLDSDGQEWAEGQPPPCGD